METKNSILIIITVILVTGFLIMQPKISSNFPGIRNSRLNTFIESSIQSQSIDLQKYWEVREFYSPGETELFLSPTFHTSSKPNRPIFESILDQSCQPQKYSRFTSNLVTAETYLVINTCQIPVFPENQTILLNTDSDKIFKTSNSIVIYSMRKPEEMAIADGFLSFDYRNAEFRNKISNKNIFIATSFNTH